MSGAVRAKREYPHVFRNNGAAYPRQPSANTNATTGVAENSNKLGSDTAEHRRFKLHLHLRHAGDYWGKVLQKTENIPYDNFVCPPDAPGNADAHVATPVVSDGAADVHRDSAVDASPGDVEPLDAKAAMVDAGTPDATTRRLHQR